MPGTYVVISRAPGTLITELIYNFDHQQHVDGRSAEFMGSYGVSASQFQLTEDPLPGGTESLPPSLAGEITRIRFVLAQIISELSGGASANWYDAITAPGVPFVGARVVRTSVISIPNNSATVINFSGGTANFNSTDPSAVWSNSVNPSRFTAPIAGKYYAFASVVWNGGTDGTRRELSVALNTAAMPGTSVGNISPSGAVQPQSIACLFDMNANDYVEFSAFHTGGSGVTLTNATFSGLNGSLNTVGGLVFLGT